MSPVEDLVMHLYTFELDGTLPKHLRAWVIAGLVPHELFNCDYPQLLVFHLQYQVEFEGGGALRADFAH
jgi:hypothetical protein